MDDSTAKFFVDVDFLFLASDSIQSRLVFNAIIHQYLIPGVQIGAKVPVIQDNLDAVEPTVITLNVLSAAQAVNDMVMLFTGLYREGVKLPHQIHFVRERLRNQVESMADEFCPDCSDNVFSRRARGGSSSTSSLSRMKSQLL